MATKSKKISVAKAVTSNPETIPVKKQKPCTALVTGHRSCKCGREGCGNGS
jgi:hypothetical protein